jgi:hypothetical protein
MVDEKRWNGKKTDSKEAPLPRNKRGYNGDPFGIEKETSVREL